MQGTDKPGPFKYPGDILAKSDAAQAKAREYMGGMRHRGKGRAPSQQLRMHRD